MAAPVTRSARLAYRTINRRSSLDRRGGRTGHQRIAINRAGAGRARQVVSAEAGDSVFDEIALVSDPIGSGETRDILATVSLAARGLQQRIGARSAAHFDLPADMKLTRTGRQREVMTLDVLSSTRSNMASDASRGNTAAPFGWTAALQIETLRKYLRAVFGFCATRKGFA